MGKYTVFVRKKIVVNDDPHNRWYHGVPNRTRTELLETEVCAYKSFNVAQKAAATFKALNPGRSYHIRMEIN